MLERARHLPGRKGRARALPAWALRASTGAWPVLQGTAAATLAWMIAKHVALHPEPFFAPIAAMLGLNAPPSERGTNTLRMLLGVFVGIVVSELTLLSLGAGYGRMALATFVAMVVALAFGGSRIVVGHAASSAILTLATASGEYGLHRVGDAAIGAAVALGFSQVLFSPEPVRLVRRAEMVALRAIAEGLARTAEALEKDDSGLEKLALEDMRDLRDRLADLGRSEQQSPSVARYSAVWWMRRIPLVAERERAGYLDLLGTSCLMLTRTALTTVPPHRARLAATFHELNQVLGALSKNPGDRGTRQRAVSATVLVTRRFEHETAPSDSTFAAALVSLRLVLDDLLLFAGVEREAIVEASQDEAATRRRLRLSPFSRWQRHPAPLSWLRRPRH